MNGKNVGGRVKEKKRWPGLRVFDPENARFKAISVGMPTRNGKTMVPQELFPCLVVHMTDLMFPADDVKVSAVMRVPRHLTGLKDLLHEWASETVGMLGLWATLIYPDGKSSTFNPDGVGPFDPVKVKPFDGVIVEWEGLVTGRVSVEDMPRDIERLLRESTRGWAGIKSPQTT